MDMSDPIPLGEETSGFFSLAQKDHERMIQLAQSVSLWLDMVGSIDGYADVAEKVRAGLRDGSIVWCIRDSITVKNRMTDEHNSVSLDVKGGEWTAFPVRDSERPIVGNAVMIQVTPEFNPTDISDARNKELLYIAISAIARAERSDQPRITADILTGHKIRGLDVMRFPPGMLQKPK